MLKWILITFAYDFLDNLPEEVLQHTPSKLDGTTNSVTSNSSDALRILLVSHFTDIDEQTLYFWVKSATGVWPTSIQMSINGTNAIVKIPADCDIGKHLLM